jgi:6-phosphogluconolactonase (cycloisomerase 2 family)
MISVQSNLLATTITPVPGSPFNSPNDYTAGLAYSPNGQWLAATNSYYANTVSVYSVAANGVLTQIFDSPFDTNGSAPECTSYSPDNQFLVVGNYGNNSPFAPATISLFSVNQSTGALTQLDPSMGLGHPSTNTLTPEGARLETIYYSPNGKFVAVALNAYGSDSAVGMYTVDPTTGALTLAGTFPTNHELDNNVSDEIAFSPDSRFIAQANSDGTNTITIFTVDQTTGELGPQNGSVYGTDYPVPGGSGYFSSIDYSPNGKLLVVSDAFNNLYTFTLNNGVPTFAATIQAPSVPSGYNDTSVVFSPDSQFIVLANDNTTDLFVFSVDANGNMSPFGAPLSAGLGISDLVFSPVNAEGFTFLSAVGLNTIYSYAFSTTSTPTNVVGIRKNNVFLLQTARYLTITWTGSSGAVSYNIYNGTTLVGNVLATSPLTFNALLPNGDNGTNFFVTAVNSSGTETAPVPVMVM